MHTLNFGMIGAGFWAEFQAHAWGEVPGARLVAICDRDENKAASLGRKLGVSQIFTDARSMFRSGSLDFVDIVTGPETHESLVCLAAECRVPVICQKPMALDDAQCERMVATCHAADVPFLVHENYRWQVPLRRVKEILVEGRIGQPFRAHIQFSHGDLRFFDRQPYLYEQPHFALFDMGPHLLDLARFYFGEPESLVARELHVHPRMRGEDIVSVMLHYPRLLCHCELTWRTSGYEVFIEGEQGTITSYSDGRVNVDTSTGASSERFTPHTYPWANPDYGHAHASIVATNRNLLAGLNKTGQTETTAADNLKTMRLVFRALESRGNCLPLDAGISQTTPAGRR